MVDDEELSEKARRLAAVIEPFAAQVYFAPECHAGYVDLGFSPSPAERNGVALPDGSAYFCSRGSLLGQVPGDLVASTFAVFNPLYHCVELVRHCAFGLRPGADLVHVAALIAFAALAWRLAVWRTRVRLIF